MNTNNIFSLKRFGLLFRYNIIHTYKQVRVSFFAMVGMFFIFIVLKSLINEGPNLDQLAFFFVLFGVLYIGGSFPAFRTKEKSQVFIMIPASVTEKFLFEFFIRVILSILVLPFLLWFAYLIQGSFYEAVSGHTFTPISLINVWEKLVEKFGYVLIPSMFILILVILFMGASIFMKQPIIKTFFFFTVLFIIHYCIGFIFSIYWRMQQFTGGSPFWIKEREDVFVFLGIYFIILTIGFLSVAYYKLKEREV